MASANSSSGSSAPLTVVKAFAAYEAKGTMKPFEYTPRPLGPTDVDIAISHCGVCHSDLHGVDNDWKSSKYPMVPGHEIVGIVTALGDDVKSLKIGDRVGVGPCVGTCGKCSDCKAGESQYCSKYVPVYNGKDHTGRTTYGGFADGVRVDAQFAYRLPDSLPSETAAPLLCAGITVWSPLVRFANPGQRVGVIGIGGLGHLALQFARALGCTVIALTSSGDKAREAKQQFGAHDAVDTSDFAAVLQQHRKSFDLLLCTVSAQLNWNGYLMLLKPGGTFCMVGVPAGAMKVSPGLLSVRGLRIAGSNTGSPQENRDMLAFAAKHKIVARTELFAMENVNAALDKVRANTLRYRAVLVRSKL